MSDESPRDALTIDLAVLRRRGIDRHAIDLTLPAGWLGEALVDTDATADQPGRVELQVLLQPRSVVYVHGALAVQFTVPCGRCLADAHVADRTKITATFMPAADGATKGGRGGKAARDAKGDEDELDLADADLDTWTYAGTQLELSELVAEHVKLTYPMRALCSRGDDCRGLCSNCGTDLNAQEGLRCLECGAVVPQTPVDDLPAEADADGAPGAGEDDGSGGSGPLADALRKLMS
jgi:uncharacterized metal-binding protein YceD (DUF177 family)